MPSVVIAAHNEAAVVGRCLDSLLPPDAPAHGLEVVVVANGCTDRTAEVARARGGVTVLETPRPSKVAALDLGDAAVSTFPRIYLDADIVVTPETVRDLCAALSGPGAPLVAVPSRHLELAGRPLVVRAYYAVQRHLPAFESGLFGRGLVALSREGRERFGTFPEQIADDLFLDSLFKTDERVRLPGLTTSVETPMRTRDLLDRLSRVRRGNAALRGADLGARAAVRPADRWSWLRDVVIPRPWLAPAGVVYAVVTLLAEHRARRTAGATTWGRDESSRQAVA